MAQSIPRLRVFAGPNGSGKSTLLAALPPPLVATYVNADEIERDLREAGSLALGDYGIEMTSMEVREALRASSFVQHLGLAALADGAHVDEAGRLSFPGLAVHPYQAAALADLVRWRLLDDGASFTFETVMSSRDKIDFLAEARRRGYRTYLYFVTTVAPELNVARVASRVAQGGHPVPEDKIVARYHRTLAHLADALRHTDRAFVFDNSDTHAVLLAEVVQGEAITMHTAAAVPRWFMDYVWTPLMG